MIVGIQWDWNSGVAVYDNGKIIYASSEERFTRKKNDVSFPEHSLNEAIKVCGLTPDNIEKVVIPTENVMPYQFLCNISDYSVEDYIREENEYFYPNLIKGENVDYLEVFKDKAEKSKYRDLYQKVRSAPVQERRNIFAEWKLDYVCEFMKIDRQKVTLFNHEYSHAAYGLYASDFSDKDEVLTVVYDGWGDESNASIYVHENGRLRQIKKYSNYNIGRLYRYMTLLLAMKPNEHEYKVMGLAPYSSEYTYRKPLEVFRKAYGFKNGEVVIDPELHENYFYFKERLEGMRFDGIAAGLQIETEEMNKALVSYWMEKTGKRKVALSGGVAMNIKANMEIGKMDIVDDIFVAGSGDDTSLCIGGIFAYLDNIGRADEIREITDMYLGCAPDDYDEVIKKIDKDIFDVYTDIDNNVIARYISEGKILGRVAGKMEFGARALGNRSVLADPRDINVVERINKKIKSRDFWMPFTPSILKEEEERLLNNEKGFRFPFMAIACESTGEARKDIPAALHPSDHTARPQIVTREMNGPYYDLISAFKKITGVGALLNTSLNIHGYPIVNTYSDGYNVLINTDLDGLIIGGDTLVLRKNSSHIVMRSAEND